MARLNQQYYADNVSLKKEGRTLSLEQEFLDKLEEFPDVIDNVTSASSTDALSANMGRHLQDQIDQLSSVGTFLSLWDCTTGLPTTDPTTNPYQYKIGTYYIVDKVADAWGTNYRPKGSQYNAWVASTDVETEDVKVWDWYLYDGTVWIRQPNSGKEIVIDEQLSLSSRNAVENRVVTAALNNKQDTISDLETIRQWAAKGATSVQPWDNISVLTNNLWYQTEGDVVNKLTNYYTKTEADALLNDKADNSDVDSLESRIETLETSSWSQWQEITNIETNITNIEWDITNIQWDITDIKTDITNIEWDITTIEGNITTIQWDITDIKNDITTIEWDITTIEWNITTIQWDITDIKGDITNLQTAVDWKQDKLTAWDNIKITWNTISAINTFDWTPYTQTEYDALPNSKNTDWVWRVVYE